MPENIDWSFPPYLEEVELLVCQDLPCCWETGFLHEGHTFYWEASKMWSSRPRAEQYFLSLARQGRSGCLVRRDAVPYVNADHLSDVTILAFTCASIHDAWQADPNCTNTTDLVAVDPDAYLTYRDRPRYLFRQPTLTAPRGQPITP